MKDASNAIVNTLLNIVFIDIANPKVGYFVYFNKALAKIKYIKNQQVTLEYIFNNDIAYTNFSAIKNKYIKFLSIHSKITHSINHTSNGKLIKVIKEISDLNNIYSPDEIVTGIIENTIIVNIKGIVVPVYVYPNIDSELCVTSKKVIEDFKLVTETDRLAKLIDIHRNGKLTIYTIVTTSSKHIMCDRSDFKLIGKLDRKDLFSIL